MKEIRNNGQVQYTFEVHEWSDDIKTEIISYDSFEHAVLAEELLKIIKSYDNFPSFKARIEALVEPLGMKYGDDIGGFASRYKWHNENKSLYLGWNSWWNFFTLVVRDYDAQIQNIYHLYDKDYAQPRMPEP